MSKIKIILLVLLLVFILIQFVRPARNENAQVSADQIGYVYAVPEYVKSVLKASCYDCHSNNTHYPWYAEIQPAGWWLASHIKKGKSELNFDEFGEYSKRRQDSKLKAIANSIEDGTMPLRSYTLMHTKARLSKDDQMRIIDWVNMTRDSLSKKTKQ